jgi:hypothetical protein
MGLPALGVAHQATRPDASPGRSTSAWHLRAEKLGGTGSVTQLQGVAGSVHGWRKQRSEDTG